MKSFPLGDMEICYEELRRDLLYDKIPAHVRQEICRRAWETGVRAAWGQADKGQVDKGRADKGQMAEIGRLIEKQKLRVQRLEKDWVVGGMRFFGEYVDGQKKIILYNGSVSRLAGSCGLSHAQAEELILAHEYYHFLECTCLGRTSRQYTVPPFGGGDCL